MIAPVRTTPVQHETITGPTALPAPGSILPEPATATAGGMQDAMSLLYALMTKLDDASSAASKQGVVAQTAAKKAELKKTQEAIDKEIQAKKDADHASHGFWHSLGVVGKVVGDVAGVVAVAAASVVTFGASAAVAVVAMSVTGAVLKETGLGGAAGQWIGLGLSLGASACTLGVSDVSVVTQGISAGGDVASGAGAVGDGVANKEIDDANADGDDAVADQTKAQQQLDRHQHVIEDMLEVMKQVHDSHKSALQSLQQAMQTNGATSVAVSAQIGRA